MGLFDSIVKFAKSVSDSVADATSEAASNAQDYQAETAARLIISPMF